MRTRVRTLAAGIAAIALVAAASVMGMSSASAEVIVINDPIAGDLVVNGKNAALPAGATADGTYNDESGALAITVTVPEGVLVATVPGFGEVPVAYQLSNPGGVTGVVDGDGNVTATGNFQLDLISAAVGEGVPLAPCSFGPIVMDFTGTLATDGALTLNAPAFEIPATADACGGLASFINPEVAGTNNSATLIVQIDLPVATTTTTTLEPTTTTTSEPVGTTTTTVSADVDGSGATAPATGTTGAAGPATGAQPVAATANYTG